MAPRASMPISVRYSPMPSAPVVSSCATSIVSPTFSIRQTLVPSAVIPGRSRNGAQPASSALLASISRR